MKFLKINDRLLGPGNPVYIIAEMSANHCQDFDLAAKIIETAKESGADAVKLQTYTPDTITIDCRSENFIFQGRTLYELYKDAYTPWEWHPRLKEIAHKLNIDLFSSPFDPTAVDFLEKMNVPVYKLASSEIIDIPLIRKIARTGKPVILSTGMATKEEIASAIKALRREKNNQIVLLKCTATYPAVPEEMNLKTIPQLAEVFNVLVGISDHTLGNEASLAAVALGGAVIERHFTLSRENKSPDAEFSLEPHEFRAMVDSVRKLEKSLGTVTYGPVGREAISIKYRRSLFVVEDIAAGEIISAKKIRSIRPGQGLLPDFLPKVIGRKARRALQRGTPVTWDALE